MNRDGEGIKDGSDAIHAAGQVIVADGTREAAARLPRVLTADPATGIFRHVDAGYEKACQIAGQRGVMIPG